LDVEGARRIEGAGGFHRPHEGTTHWIEHLRSDHLSVGTYSIAAGGADDQVPHTEDEVYVVVSGTARLVTPSGSIPVGSGDAVFVPAGEHHTFVDVVDDFTTIVVFAPPERDTSENPAPGDGARSA
jgi:mannose-6-phosphate isomerase-like protein (cupin superfamily)